MLLNITKSLNLGAPQNEAWQLLRDLDRLAAFVPGVESLAIANAVAHSEAPAAGTVSTHSQNDGLEEKYVARVIEKVGPFRLDLNLGIRIIEAEEPSSLKAELTGSDRGGQNRIRGTLSADLKPGDSAATLMNFSASVEVLGKLASLGAAPIRRRAHELFDEFAAHLQQQFPPVAEPFASRTETLQPEEKTAPAPVLPGPAAEPVATAGKPTIKLASLAVSSALGLATLGFLLKAGMSLWGALAAAGGFALLIRLALGAIKRE